MINISPIIEAIIGLAVTLLTALFIPYIKSKLDANKLEKLTFWLEKGVLAVEEADRKGLINKSEKFDAVVDLLKEKGFTFDEKQIETLIDGAVYELINQFKADKEGKHGGLCS